MIEFIYKKIVTNLMLYNNNKINRVINLFFYYLFNVVIFLIIFTFIITASKAA